MCATLCAFGNRIRIRSPDSKHALDAFKALLFSVGSNTSMSDDVDEAVALANEGVYGLSAAVFAGSLSRKRRARVLSRVGSSSAASGTGTWSGSPK